MSVIAPTRQLKIASAVRAARSSWSEQTLCSLSEMSECIRLVNRAMGSHAYSDRDQHAVRLALDESLTNAIRHGNGENTDKSVILRYLVLTDQVWIKVEDQGDGFDLNEVPDPRLSENLARPSGRGLLLMRRSMDLVEYSNGGRTLLMSKRRGGMLAGLRDGLSTKAF